MNTVVLVGRMTRDPELRRTQQGDAVTSFTLAVNRQFKNAEGNYEADFINCVIWKKQAENVERYCSKGSQVAVEGRIQTRNYDNNQGQKVYVTEVICNSVQFLDSKNDNSDMQKVDEQSPFDNSKQFDIMEEDIEF